MNRQLSTVCGCSLAAPLTLAVAWLVFVVGGDITGAGPFVNPGPKNSAEAAGLARAADVLRFMRMGEDPHHLYPVRPEVISSAVLRVTTLEAAIWSRQLELVQLLDDQHPISREDRHTLACLAADLKVDDVVEYLAPEGTGYCVPGQTLEHVIARSRGV